MKCLHKNFVNIIHNLEKKIPKGKLYGGQTICKRLAEEQHEKHKVDKIKNKGEGRQGELTIHVVYLSSSIKYQVSFAIKKKIIYTFVTNLYTVSVLYNYISPRFE